MTPPPPTAKKKQEPVDPEIVARLTEAIPDNLSDFAHTYFVRQSMDEAGLVEGIRPAQVVVQWPQEGFSIAWLTSLWIPYTWRGRGMGSALLKHVVGLIHAAGHHAALAALPYDPDPDQRMKCVDLVAWYQARGFVPLEGNILISRVPQT